MTEPARRGLAGEPFGSGSGGNSAFDPWNRRRGFHPPSRPHLVPQVGGLNMGRLGGLPETVGCEPTRAMSETGGLAEGVGFEPTGSLHPRRFSRPVP